jgi:YteA family regulatory protein
VEDLGSEEKFRQRILEERARLLQARSGRTESMRDWLGEVSLYDNHPADIGTELADRSRDLAFARGRERRLRDLEEALARWERGEYGICRGCGKAIEEERLMLLPETEFCRECKEEREREGRRPTEEEPLEPPFHRGYREAWDDVARYGTSFSEDNPLL